MCDDVNFEFGHLVRVNRSWTSGFFDAELVEENRNASTNAELWLHIRVLLMMVYPGPSGRVLDLDGVAVPARDWTPPEFRQWVAKYLQVVRNGWDRKFWLKTPESYRGLDWPTGHASHRCNLTCRLEITNSDSFVGVHAEIPVVRTQPGHFFRSGVLLYSSQDIVPERIYQTSPHIVVNHEVGHLLGLHHPGFGRPGCSHGNERICYAADKLARMGMGDQLRVAYAAPWRRAAAQMTGIPAEHWAVSLTPLSPFPLEGKRVLRPPGRQMG